MKVFHVEHFRRGMICFQYSVLGRGLLKLV
jgi:hypothetical protein